jgi:hypothetical protein
MPKKNASDLIADELRAYNDFVRMVNADPQRPEDEKPEPKWLEIYRGRVRSVGFARFRQIGAATIERFIN